MEINYLFEGSLWPFDMAAGKLVSVQRHKHASVTLAFDGGENSFNIAFADIRLHDLDRFVDAMRMFPAAVLLGEEIERRWNEYASAQKALETLDLIDKLREDEGDSVTIVSDNGDFNGQPQCLITCQGGWTGWEDEWRFAGDTVLDRLRAAWAKRQEGTANPP